MKLFVVGSGRSGSTLLTEMLSHHPDLFVVSEFFAALDRDRAWTPGDFTGEAFSELIGRTNIPTDIQVRRGVVPKELLGDVSQSSVLPPLMIATLPLQFDNPAEVQREAQAAACTFPTQSLAAHYEALFGWLTTRAHKSFWLERSGPSLEYLPDLVQAFPDGKFVNLHRSGVECSLSMRNHPYFQLIVSFFFDPPSAADMEKTEFGGQPVDKNDMLSRRMTPGYMPAARYADYWSYQQIMGFKGFAKLDPAQYIDVAFEDLVADPPATLGRIAQFLGLPERPDWIADAAELVAGQPPSRLSTLPQQDQDDLVRHCETGELLLGRKQSDWVNPTLMALRDLSVRQFGY